MATGTSQTQPDDKTPEGRGLSVDGRTTEKSGTPQRGEHVSGHDRQSGGGAQRGSS